MKDGICFTRRLFWGDECNHRTANVVNPMSYSWILLHTMAPITGCKPTGASQPSPYQYDVVIAYHTTLHLVKYFSNPQIERPNHVKVSFIHEERLFLVTPRDYPHKIIAMQVCPKLDKPYT